MERDVDSAALLEGRPDTEKVIFQRELTKPLTRAVAIDHLQRLALPYQALTDVFGRTLRYAEWKASFSDPLDLVEAAAWRALKIDPDASAYLVTFGVLDKLCEGIEVEATLH